MWQAGTGLSKDGPSPIASAAKQADDAFIRPNLDVQALRAVIHRHWLTGAQDADLAHDQLAFQRGRRRSDQMAIWRGFTAVSLRGRQRRGRRNGLGGTTRDRQKGQANETLHTVIMAAGYGHGKG